MILNLDFHAQQLQIPYFSYIRYKKFSESSLWSKHYFIYNLSTRFTSVMSVTVTFAIKVLTSFLNGP